MLFADNFVCFNLCTDGPGLGVPHAIPVSSVSSAPNGPVQSVAWSQLCATSPPQIYNGQHPVGNGPVPRQTFPSPGGMVPFGAGGVQTNENSSVQHGGAYRRLFPSPPTGHAPVNGVPPQGAPHTSPQGGVYPPQGGATAQYPGNSPVAPQSQTPTPPASHPGTPQMSAGGLPTSHPGTPHSSYDPSTVTTQAAGPSQGEAHHHNADSHHSPTSSQTALTPPPQNNLMPAKSEYYQYTLILLEKKIEKTNP